MCLSRASKDRLAPVHFTIVQAMWKSSKSSVALYIGGHLRDFQGLPSQGCTRCLYREVTTWPSRERDPMLCDACRAKAPDPSDHHFRWLWIATVTQARCKRQTPGADAASAWDLFAALPPPAAGSRAMRRRRRCKRLTPGAGAGAGAASAWNHFAARPPPAAGNRAMRRRHRCRK